MQTACAQAEKLIELGLASDHNFRPGCPWAADAVEGLVANESASGAIGPPIKRPAPEPKVAQACRFPGICLTPMAWRGEPRCQGNACAWPPSNENRILPSRPMSAD